MPLRVVVLTNGNAYALRVLSGLADRNVRIAAVVIERPLGLRKYRTASGSRWTTPRDKLSTLKTWAWNARRFASTWIRASEVAQHVVITGPLNSERMVRDLSALKPDVIALGGVGILRPPLLNVARCGVINAHPGLLPWVRGSGVVGRAIQRGVAVGCTCHFVNAGIDTGAIIERRLLHVPPGGIDLLELEHAADLLCARVMVDVLAEAVACGALPNGTDQPAKHPICKWMTPQERSTLEHQLREGRARALFEEWLPLCSGPDDFRLVPAAAEHSGDKQVS